MDPKGLLSVCGLSNHVNPQSQRTKTGLYCPPPEHKWRTKSALEMVGVAKRDECTPRQSVSEINMFIEGTISQMYNLTGLKTPALGTHGLAGLS